MTKQQKIERLARFVGGVRLGFRINDKRWVVTSPGDKGASRLFDPYTRLDDAMMVAEKIARGDGKGDSLHTVMMIRNPTTEHWGAKFNPYDYENYFYADTLAAAIALAADAYLDATGFK